MEKLLAGYLDFAHHRANTTPDEIKEVCARVVEYGFNGAFVNPAYIPLVREHLAGRAKVGTALAFPLGQETTLVKVASALEAIRLGADELDIVPNLGLFLAGLDMAFSQELKDIVAAIKKHSPGTVVKFILDTGFLDHLPNAPERIKQAAKLVKEAGSDFVKIGSGFGPRGASLNDLKLVREAVGREIEVKVSGGIDTYAQAQAFIDAGASRIGTSHAVEIIKGAPTP